MRDTASSSNARIDRQPDPDLLIRNAHLAAAEFVDLVVETLDSSAYIEVGKLNLVGEDGQHLCITEVEPDEQA